MTVLITYASKHGATQGIAEHIADTLRGEGLDVEVRPVAGTGDLDRYDAFVIGSAIYFGSWQKDAARFVQRNQSLLAAKPVWLFSSGPVGEARVDDDGRDLRETSEPKQMVELRNLIQPRDERVFFGALDRDDFSLAERVISSLPAASKLFAEGDFRDWDEIAGWSREIARDLARAPATTE